MPWELVLVLLVLLALAFYIGSRALLEPQRPEFTFYRIPRADEASKGETALRLVFFSDYHYPLNHLPPEILFNFIKEQKPDAVLFGGDMASRPKDLAGGQELAQRISAFCAEMGIPYIAVRGNHDDCLDRAEGYPLLINQHFIVHDRSGRPWKIIGLEDIRLGKIDFAKACSALHPDSPAVSETIPASRFVVLAHNPDSVLLLEKNSAAYCLSGHFHGGQIKLPFKMEYTVLRDEVLCRTGFTEAFNPIRGMRLFISRGWGEVLFPLRLGARPELSLLELKEPEAPAASALEDEKIEHYLSKHAKHYPYIDQS